MQGRSHVTSAPSTQLVGKTLTGNYKYIGIVTASNGKLYNIPYSASKVLCYDIYTSETYEIGDNLGYGGGKWHGGTLAENGKIYCNPCYSNDILVIDPSDDSTQIIPTNLESISGNCKYSSCVSAKNGFVYFFPRAADKLMKLNVSTNILSFIEDGDDTFKQHWADSIFATNGFIYVLPLFGKYMMQFNPSNDTAKAFKSPIFNRGYQYKQLVEHTDGNLYAVPQCGKQVLKINLTNHCISTVGNDLSGDDGGALQQNWNWCASVVGGDGCIYGIPSSALQVIKFDPADNSTTMIGAVYSDQFKWSGGCYAQDGNIYGAPLRAAYILKISIPIKSSANHIACHNRENKEKEEQETTLERKMTCVICLSAWKCVLFSPCHHVCTCIDCGLREILQTCPICRTAILKKTKLYL